MKDFVLSEWNSVAINYSKEQRTSINSIVNREMIKELLGDITNLEVLDAGCGDGFLSNELKNLGAKVHSFDGSKTFINQAKSEFLDIDFNVCNIKKPLPYKSKSFDIIVSSLVLMDIDDVSVFFKEAHRILKDNGKLIFSIVHPCYFYGEWIKDENGNKKSKVIEKYLSQFDLKLNIWGETSHFHRPISWYSKIINDNGFTINQLKEQPENPEILNLVKPHQRELPLFLCFLLKKC